MLDKFPVFEEVGEASYI